MDMSSRVIAIFGVGLAVLTCVPAQSVAPLDRTTTSSINTAKDEDGNTIVTTINRGFRLLEEPCSLEARHSTGALLLQEEFRSRISRGHEGQEGIVKVGAWAGRSVNALIKKWDFEQEGHHGTPWDCFYKVTKYGCCMTPSTDVYYSLITGNKVFTSNSPLFGIVVPNTTILLDRYFAYLSSYNGFDDRQGAKPQDLVAVIQYGSETETLSRIAVYSKRADHLLPPKISFLYENKRIGEETLMLSRVDGKKDKTSLSNFALVLSYEGVGEIVIPVSNDKIDLDKVTISKTFWLESVAMSKQTRQASKAK